MVLDKANRLQDWHERIQTVRDELAGEAANEEAGRTSPASGDLGAVVGSLDNVLRAFDDKIKDELLNNFRTPGPPADPGKPA